MLNRIGFVTVPATAGAVIVAVPLVKPERLMRPAVVPTMPAVTLVFPVSVVKVPAAGVVPPIAPGTAGLNGGNPLSVNVQVVLETVQVTVSPVTGTAANPRIVFDVVAALPHVVVKFPLAGNMASVPAMPDAPSVGVAVRAGVAPARISPTAPPTAHVPVVVMVPPVSPVPQVTLVTVPVPALAGTFPK